MHLVGKAIKTEFFIVKTQNKAMNKEACKKQISYVLFMLGRNSNNYSKDYDHARTPVYPTCTRIIAAL